MKIKKCTGKILVAVTGPDGCGKTTFCHELKKELDCVFGAPTARVVSIWDKVAPQGIFETKERARAYVHSLNGVSRTLFLFHALSQALESALNEDEPVLVLDGYYFKYAVSEMGLETDPRWIREMALFFPKPAMTFFLKVDPETAGQRKKSWTRYECGNVKKPSARAFLNFQSRLGDLWRNVNFRDHSWFELSSHDPLESNWRFAARKIMKLHEGMAR